MRYLTIEQVKRMPISMQIIKAIKDNFGVPTKAYATTVHGEEFNQLVLEGLDVKHQDLYKVVDQYRTEVMRLDDWDAVCDPCVVISLPVGSRSDVPETITDLFKEI